MKDNEIKAEFEQLRAQLNQLQKSREQAETQSAEEIDDTAVDKPADEPDRQAVLDSDESWESDQGDVLAAKFQELFDALETDIKQTNPSTLLVIFAMGVVVGRLLHR